MHLHPTVCTFAYIQQPACFSSTLASAIVDIRSIECTNVLIFLIPKNFKCYDRAKPPSFRNTRSPGPWACFDRDRVTAILAS
jgi:hypothetical protein